MPYGYAGKLLNVDLGRNAISEEHVPEGMLHDLIGGYGVGARILLQRMKAGADPFGPDNILGFMTGPLTGSGAPFGTRYTIVGKSPLTLTWGDANSGGDFGPYLKFSGCDGVFLSGVAERPVYLHIEDGAGSLQDASGIWGRDTHETEAGLLARHGREARVACIGPAGEMMSLISCVINDRGRAAGRSGLGAVMGSKHLKAIVVSGRQPVTVADPGLLKVLSKKYNAALTGPLADGLRDYGTSAFVAGALRIGDAPVKNWGGSALVFPHGEAISDASVTAFQARRYGCWRCPVRCGGVMKAGSGDYRWEEGAHKPEYETIAAFGSLCLNDNVPSIVKFNDLCNRLGLDTISAGGTVAFAVECYENGLISKGECDGLELNWGNHRAMVDLVVKMGNRQGIGEVLADGVKRAAERIGRGSERFAMHVSGQEVPMHDPKCRPDYGTTYQVDATPGRHTQGHESFVPFGLGIPRFDRTKYAGRGPAHRVAALMAHGVNASGMCLFGYACMPGDALPALLSAVTGLERDLGSVQLAGERMACLRQLFDLREGINPFEFRVPDRVAGRPPPDSGPSKGITADLDNMSRDFYAALKWDPATGMPDTGRIRELGLSEALEESGLIRAGSPIR